MSKSGHVLVSVSLGAIIVAVQPTFTGLLTAGGAILGASAPDVFELAIWTGGHRESVIPHRTLTHYVPFWLAAALAANLAPSPWSHVLFGVALAAALHIVVDAGSPMGVPLLNPFRPVRLCALYRTGEPSELLVIVPAIAAAAHAIVTHPAAIQIHQEIHVNPVLAAFITLLIGASATAALNPQIVSTLYAEAVASVKSPSPSPLPSATPIAQISASPEPVSSACAWDERHRHRHHRHHDWPSPSPIIAQVSDGPVPIESPDEWDRYHRDCPVPSPSPIAIGSPVAVPSSTPIAIGSPVVAASSTPIAWNPTPTASTSGDSGGGSGSGGVSVAGGGSGGYSDPTATPTTISGYNPTPTPTGTVSGASWTSPTPLAVASPTPVESIAAYTLSCAANTSAMPPLSACFSGNSPLHHRFATLMNAGLLTMQSSQIASNYWNTGSGNNGSAGGSGPVYLVTQSTQTVSGQINCSDGGNGCGKEDWLPSGYAVQAWTTDYHVSSIDLVHNQEIDSWEASNWPSVASSGYFPLTGGTGIPPGGHSQWGGIAGGQALGAIEATAQELLTYRLAGTHIGHALAFMSPCLSGAGVWPDIGQPTDYACSQQSATYGSLIHLKSSYSIAADPNAQADPYCAALLWAFEEYGGYASDTTQGQGGIRIFLEGQQSDSEAASLQSDSTLISKGCFSAVPSSAIEVSQFNSDNPTLPAYFGYGDPRN